MAGALDAFHTALEIGLTVEEAIALDKRSLLLVSLDLPRFFDFIEWGLWSVWVGQVLSICLLCL